jgi:hypothetical protein
MTDKALDVLATDACNPDTSLSELRRIALVAIGELSMLRKEYAALKESSFPPFVDFNCLMADPALEVPIA